VTTYGFQSATQSQFTGLLADFGLRTTTTPGGFGPFNYESGYGEAAKSFILSFGVTTFSTGTNPPSWLDINFGLYAPSSDPLMAGMGGVGLLVWNGIEYGGVLNDPAYLNLTTTDSTFGTWLYKPVASPVPEPSTWLLMGAGLLGLGWFRRRQAKA